MMKNKYLIQITIICLFLWGCSTSTEKKQAKNGVKILPKYAKGFYIIENKDYKEAFVCNPWDSNRVLGHYVFISRNSKISLPKSDAVVIKTPCKVVACLSSTEIGFVSRLGLANQILGISQKEYIKNETVLNQISQGKTIDLGPFEAYNIEKLISLNPDVLFVAPFRENKYGKISETQIPMGYCSSYMEDSPLGRAEWIKFISLFFEKENQATIIFDSIAKRYNEASKIANLIPKKPSVFSSKMYQDVWFVSGAKSYMAQYFTDAGANYIWNDKKYSGSEPIDFESVYNRCHNADYWVLLEYANEGYGYNNIVSESEKYMDFQPFKKRNVILCNTKTTAYYETGILEPDVILMDFISIFHNELLPNYKPTYFNLIKE